MKMRFLKQKVAENDDEGRPLSWVEENGGVMYAMDEPWAFWRGCQIESLVVKTRFDCDAESALMVFFEYEGKQYRFEADKIHFEVYE